MSARDGLLIRRTILSGAALVLLALVWLTAARLLGRDSEARTTPATPSSAAIEALIAFEKPEIPDDQNAAKWLVAGAGAVVWSDGESPTVGSASGRPFAEWDEDVRVAVREALDRHRGALQTLHLAVPLERSSYDIRYRDGIEAEMPDLLSLIRAARLLACEATVGFADDDPQRGLVALGTMGQMASTLYDESTLITYLIATAIERTAVSTAAEAVALDGPWMTTSFLDDLESVLPANNHSQDLRRVLAAWQATVWAAVESGESQWDLGPRGGLELPDDLTQAELQIACEGVEQLLAVPYGGAPERFAALGELIDSGEDGLGSDLDGFGKALGRAQSVAAQRQLVRAAAAMRRRALSRGSYPAERPAIPELAEPDPFTGGLIDYRPGNDGSLTLALVGVCELLDPITVGGMSRYIRPVVLPPAS